MSSSFNVQIISSSNYSAHVKKEALEKIILRFSFIIFTLFIADPYMKRKCY